MKRVHALLLGAAVFFLAPLGTRALWDSDEGRYAEIAREMLALKDWVSPHLNHVLYFEKPPLMYWLTAISMAAFGQNAFAARLWCALFALLTVAVVYAIGRRWRNERTGLLAGAITATSLGFFVFSQFLVLDMALTFWMTCALGTAWLLLQGDAERPQRVALGLAAALAGGTMTKGPVALVLPLGAIFFTALWCRRSAALTRIFWGPPVALGALLCAPWFALVAHREPFFLKFFFIHEHVERFLTNVHHREAPFYFFVPVALAGFLPWSAFLPEVFRRWFANKAFALRRDPGGALWMVWTLGVVLFFSLSHSKLVTYILPIFPALALLTAEVFDGAWDAAPAPGWIGRGLFGLAVLEAAILVFLKWPDPLTALRAPAVQAFLDQAGFLYWALAFAVFVLTGARSLRRAAPAWWGAVISQGVLLWSLCACATALNPFLSTRHLAAVLNERATPQEKVVGFGISYENVLQTLPFYTKRRVAVYGDPGELTLGRDHAPDAAQWFAPPERAAQALEQLPAGSWVVTDPERWARLRESPDGDAFALIEKQGRLCLLQKVG